MNGVSVIGNGVGDGLVDLLVGIGGKFIIFIGIKFFCGLVEIDCFFLD